MNVSEAAFELGSELRRQNEGENIFELYEFLKENTSQESWSLFQNFKARSGLNHYWSINLAYENIKNINLEKNERYKKIVEEIQFNSKFDELSNQSKTFAQSIDCISKDLLLPALPTKFNNTIAKPKLKRAIQSLYVSVHRTGFIKYVENELKKVEYRQILNSYTSERRNIPFWKANRLLIEKVSKQNNEKSYLYKAEAFFSFIEFINQLIFESHLNLISNVNSKNSSLTLQTTRFNKMEVFLLNCNASEVTFKEGALIKLEHNNTKHFGIVNQEIISFSNNKLVAKGIFYPDYDMNIFI